MKKKIMMSVGIMIICGVVLVGNHFLEQQQMMKSAEVVVNESPVKASTERTKFGVSVAIDYDNKVDMSRFKDEDYILPELPPELLEKMDAMATLGVTKSHRYDVKGNSFRFDGDNDSQGEYIELQGITYSAFDGLELLVTEGKIIGDEAITSGTNEAIMPESLVQKYNFKVGDTVPIHRLYYSDSRDDAKGGTSEKTVVNDVVLDVVGIYDDSTYMVFEHTDEDGNKIEIPKTNYIITTYDYVEQLNTDYFMVGEGKAFSDEEEKELYENDPYVIDACDKTFFVQVYFQTEEEANAFIQEIESELPDLYSAKPLY